MQQYVSVEKIAPLLFRFSFFPLRTTVEEQESVAIGEMGEIALG